MTLKKLTKHSVTGSLLVQYKYASMSGTTSGTGDTNIGSPLAFTPQYAESVLESTFSADINNDSNGDNEHFRIALYVNGEKEYEQTELLGGPRGGNEATNHGGHSDRIYQHAEYNNLYNMRQSVGMIHAFISGSLNKHEFQIKAASYNNGGKTLTVSNGFLIIKEVATGGLGLSGAQ